MNIFFKDINNSIIENAILETPDTKNSFHVHVESSSLEVVGSIFHQEFPEGKQTTQSFNSRTYTKKKPKRSTTACEIF